MSKINRELKNEIDNDFREIDYTFKKGIFRIILVIVGISCFGGIAGVIYTKTIGKAQKNAEREVFKESVAYNEQAASFLAKSYKEYNDAENESDKKAVMEYVAMRYPNLDIDGIENRKLRQFYIDCLN